MPPKRKPVKRQSLDVFDYKDETAGSPRTKGGKAFLEMFDESPKEASPYKASPKKASPKKATAKVRRSVAKSEVVFEFPSSSDEEEEVEVEEEVKVEVVRGKGKQPLPDTSSEEEEVVNVIIKKRKLSGGSGSGSGLDGGREKKKTKVGGKKSGKQPLPDTSSEEDAASPASSMPLVKSRKSVQVVVEPTETAVFKPGNPSNVWGTDDFDFTEQEKEEDEAVLKERKKKAGRLSSSRQAFTVYNVPVSADTTTLTVRELRDELSTRDLPTTGSKTMLVERLEAALGGAGKKKKAPAAKKKKPPPRKRDSLLQLSFADVTCDSDSSLSSDEALPVKKKGGRKSRGKK